MPFRTFDTPLHVIAPLYFSLMIHFIAIITSLLTLFQPTSPSREFNDLTAARLHTFSPHATAYRSLPWREYLNTYFIFGELMILSTGLLRII